MLARFGCLLGVLALLPAAFITAAPTTPASAREGRLILETWEAAYLDGNHVGHVHRLFREVTFESRKVVEATVDTDFSLRRFGQPVRLQSIHATHENAVGLLRAFVLQEGMSASQRIYRKGQVKGQELVWTTQLGTKAPTERRLPWKDTALGLYAQEVLWSQRPETAPREFSYDRFEPVFDTVLSVAVTVGPAESTPFPGQPAQSLRKVTCQLDGKLTQDAAPEYLWISDSGEILKRQSRQPLLGELTCYRTTREAATRRAAGQALDVGRSQLISLAHDLPRASETRAVTYVARLTDGVSASDAFPSDGHQYTRILAPDRVEIVVVGQRRPAPAEPFAIRQSPVPTACLQSNFFINSVDSRVKQHTQMAVGVEPDPWRRAVRIEKWVKANMRGFSSTEGFATAAEVARTLSGDCKAHAVLAAAMCRAAGVPSRIAVGLVYVPRERAMGYHMWLEVWIDGEWYGLDPTVGQGSVAADHLKVLHHDLNGEESFAPFLPLSKLAGRVKLETREVRHGLAMGPR